MAFRWIKFRTKKGRVIKFKARQTGRSKRKNDLRYAAMQPGIRISRRGRKYSEYRRNRSDMKSKKRI